MTVKFTIDKDAFYAELRSLRPDQGTWSGWGRFIKTNNQALINFVDEFLFIEYENLNGRPDDSGYAIGIYRDVTDDYWDYNLNKKAYCDLFTNLIKDAINNTGIYERYNNNF
ncbi:hypothetical protein [Kosakonia phage Kc304]|uniref:Uncharacterized protein n=2 Tax=Winklervirus chi14 TaxID=2560752 RepID=A0A1Z1LY13_9CAUD|nr:hypothetical protein FDI23_gp026 [Serratia phage CHI14]ARW57449.1 hypothetical protein [Serratia phage CHI14]ARW57724.1 hypothetical protein [Serratia phage CBH8]QYN80471.1 hypothetical protein [Kosakonia phage Kc304]